MPIRRSNQRRRIAACTYRELLRSIANTVGANAIMGVLFMVVAGACAAGARNIGLSVISIVGSIVAILRVIILVRLRERLGGERFDVRAGLEAERLYGTVYLTFAGIIGLFAALSLFLCPPEYHMTIAAMAVGFGAGVAAGMSLRPRIGIPAIAMGVTPAILASIAIGSEEHLLLALVLAVLLIAGIRSMSARYRTAVQMIEMRHLFGSLARQDPLTGLANRFALEEALARIAEEGHEDGIVLHCFDLDRFKPVNDVHGHLIGDELLKAVAGRMKRLLRPGDLAVRLGGDEFAVLQTGIRHRDEAELLARRIGRAIAEPYAIEGRQIQIGASIGSASGRAHGSDLAALVGSADIALYKVKQDRGAVRALAG